MNSVKVHLIKIHLVRSRKLYLIKLHYNYFPLTVCESPNIFSTQNTFLALFCCFCFYFFSVVVQKMLMWGPNIFIFDITHNTWMSSFLSLHSAQTDV